MDLTALSYLGTLEKMIDLGRQLLPKECQNLLKLDHLESNIERSRQIITNQENAFEEFYNDTEDKKSARFKTPATDKE